MLGSRHLSSSKTIGTGLSACTLPVSGLSQLWARVAKAQYGRKRSEFVNFLKPEDLGDEIVLTVDRPFGCGTETFLQPEHRLEPLDSSPGRVERTEPADPRHGLLNPEMVALDALLEMLGDVVNRIRRQQPILDSGSYGNRERFCAIGTDRSRRQKRFVSQHLAEEALRRIGIALGCQQEVDGVAVLVDGTIQRPPLAADLHIGLIDPDRAAMGPPKSAQPLLDQRRVSDNPTIACGIIDREAAFVEHLFQIAIAERISQMPRDCLHDQPGLELPAFEVVPRLSL